MAITTRNRIPPFSAEHLEAIARVMADTERGLTGSEIGNLLLQSEIADPDPTQTKWKRLFNAFVEFQNLEQVGNHVVMFIHRALNPAKYTSNPESFNWRRDQLNPILSFAGMTLGDDGKIRRVAAANSLTEAMARASRLQMHLQQRGVHAEVLRFCNSEILANNCFHAVFEAMKSITSKIRNLSGLTTDGSELADGAFSNGKSGVPVCAINALDSETLRGEQRGFVNLLKGLYGTVRNPLAHNPKIEWDMTEQDALDILTVLSLIHRKLDKARRI